MLRADKTRRLERIGFVWDPLVAQWEDMFAVLETFVKREGHCNVPLLHKEDGANLGTWLSSQRKAKKEEVLSTDRKRRLEDLRIVWVRHEAQWEDMFALLETYGKREGHCNVPKSHKEDGASLGTWASTQRQAQRKGGLDADKTRRLERIGFVWDPIAVQWEDMFVLLETYARREGHCNVPHTHKEDGTRLGQWVGTQRRAKKNEVLRADQARRLESIGFVWDPLVAQWEDMFAVLETFVKREGHCNVPRLHKEDGANLGMWVDSQRQAQRKGGLLADRARRLEELDIAWGRSNNSAD
jgi:hypothetical protein